MYFPSLENLAGRYFHCVLFRNAHVPIGHHSFIAVFSAFSGSGSAHTSAQLCARGNFDFNRDLIRKTRGTTRSLIGPLHAWPLL